MPTKEAQLQKILEMNLQHSGAMLFDRRLRRKLTELDCDLREVIFRLMDKIMNEEFETPYQMEKNVYNAERIING